MPKLVFAVAIIAAALVQATIIGYLRVFGAQPDLLLCCTLYAGLSFSPAWAAALGLSAGALKDMLGAGSWGINAFLFASWGYLVAQLSRKVPTDEKIMRLPLAVAVALLQNIISAAAAIGSGIAVPAGIITRNIIIGSAYTGAVFPIFFRLSRKIQPK
jgi:rod shape-determining protein MreD